MCQLYLNKAGEKEKGWNYFLRLLGRIKERWVGPSPVELTPDRLGDGEDAAQLGCVGWVQKAFSTGRDNLFQTNWPLPALITTGTLAGLSSRLGSSSQAVFPPVTPTAGFVPSCTRSLYRSGLVSPSQASELCFS